MEEDQKISDYFSKLIVVENKIKTHGEVICDQQGIEKVMRSLTSRFYFIVVAIQEFKDVKIIQIEELQRSLEAHKLIVMDRGT